MRWICLLWLLMGCSGYRFSQQDNPLAQYGIHSLSVPMFYNYSNQTAVSSEFTRETYRLLSSFGGLRLHPGYDKNSDAVLIGIIKSPEKMTDTLAPGTLQVATTKNIGDTRGVIYIPGTTIMNMVLQVIVIKQPTEEELALLKSGIGEKVQASSRLIFNALIPLNTQFTREVLDDPGTQVNATQNQGVQRKVIRDLSIQAATSIRDTILYAF